jgi:hypothetical protein
MFMRYVLEYMRRFFLAYPRSIISETLSRKSGGELLSEKSQTASRKFNLPELAQVFTLPWSAYVRLLSVKDAHARQFYEAEALRGGWSVRQLDRQIGRSADRQIGSQFYERTALSKDKTAMLAKGAAPKPGDAVTPDENPPVGLILCADKGHALARYALEGLPTKVMATNYRTVLPDAELLQKELESTRRVLESRGAIRPKTRRQ